MTNIVKIQNPALLSGSEIVFDLDSVNLLGYSKPNDPDMFQEYLFFDANMFNADYHVTIDTSDIEKLCIDNGFIKENNANGFVFRRPITEVKIGKYYYIKNGVNFVPDYEVGKLGVTQDMIDKAVSEFPGISINLNSLSKHLDNIEKRLQHLEIHS